VTPAALLLLPLLLTAEPMKTIEVELLSSKPCRSLSVEGPGGRRDVASRDGKLLLDGRPAQAPLRLAPAVWRLEFPAPARRTVAGALEFRAGHDRLRVVARLDLEEYVAWTVASETAPGTPSEALRAQAVVARSYALASGRRHADVDLCDLAHCQVLRGGLAAGHRDAARRAASATRGEVLRLASGRAALAAFHAACGGHTANPAEVFGGDETGAAAVPDDGCPTRAWRAVVPAPIFEAVVLERFGETAVPEALEWRRGRGGYVVQVALDGRAIGGDAFARSLDGRLGHRTIRSARFTANTIGHGVLVEGTGVGHGVGLCQAGAVRRASGGATYRQILEYYFPRARLSGP
jgi:stage II sporulation protein D